ncbi:MAG: hypothetical protein MK096_13640 [Oleiphilaceae bacterium]|nr:hypothetical protein [Oleiphilaceae bacterium]
MAVFVIRLIALYFTVVMLSACGHSDSSSHDDHDHSGHNSTHNNSQGHDAHHEESHNHEHRAEYTFKDSEFPRSGLFLNSIMKIPRSLPWARSYFTILN